MKEFWHILVRFASPYKKYLGGAVILNLLSAVFNIFSFSLIIPILQMLFRIDTTVYEFIPWDSGASIKDMLTNNMYYYASVLMDRFGGSMTLLLLGVFL